MIDLTSVLVQGGTSGIVALIVIAYLYFDSKKKPSANGLSKAILTELQTQNENHLEHIQTCITDMGKNIIDGNKEIVKAITDLHIDIIKEIQHFK